MSGVFPFRALARPLVLRPARRDRLRFLLTISGIAVGVATFTAIRLANDSVLSSFSETVDFVAGRASLTVLAEGAGVPEVTLSRLAWTRARGALLAPVLSETAAAGAADGEVVEVLGIDPVTDSGVRDYAFEEKGTARSLLKIFDPEALLVTDVFARAHRLGVGDSLPLVAGGIEHRMKIAGILRPQGPARAASGSIVFADIATVQKLFSREGRLDRIDITFPDSLTPSERTALEEEIRNSLPPGVTVGRPERRGETVERLVRAFRINLTALGLIALFVGVFFVYNTLSISVLRRRADIGTLRALGASRLAVFGVFLAEGAALGMTGSALGIGLGAALARLALAAVGGTATELYMPSAHPSLHLDPGILFSSFAFGVVASVLSALAPAREAARIEPASAMRRGSVEAIRRSLARPLAMFGGVLLAAAFFAARQKPVGGLPLFGFLSVFLVFSGVSLLTPGVLLLACRFGDRTALRLFGVEARIARANLTGSLSRTSVAVAALMMGIAMMVSVAVMVGSFRTTVIRWVDQTLAADLFITPASGRSNVSFGRMSEEAVRAVAAVPGIAEVDPYLAFGATRNGAPFTVGSGRFDFIAEHGNLPLVDGRDTRRVLREALAAGEVLVSEPYAQKFGVRSGDRVELPTGSGPVSFRIAAVYTDYSNDRGTVTLDRAQFQKLYGIEGASSVAVTLAPGVSPEEGARRVTNATRGRFALRIRTNAVLRKHVLQIFDRTFAVTYALEAVAIAVAVLGVFNTLIALVLERRREIGLLRVLGASKERVRRAVRYESAAIGGLGSLLGLVAGGAMSLILVKVINKQSFGWTIETHWPWKFLAGSLSLVLATTWAAAHHPARLAADVDPVAALQEE